MKSTKTLSYIFLITLTVLSMNVSAQDLPKGAITQINTGQGPINAIAYSRATNQLAVAAGKIIIIYDASTYRELMQLSGHTDAVLALAFSPNGKLLVSGGSDKTVRLWETETVMVVHGVLESPKAQEDTDGPEKNTQQLLILLHSLLTVKGFGVQVAKTTQFDRGTRVMAVHGAL